MTTETPDSQNAAAKIDAIVGPGFYAKLEAMSNAINDKIYEAADQFVGFITMLAGSAGNAKDAIIAKADNFMAKSSAPTEKALSVRKLESPGIERSPSQELGQMARMSVGVPNQFQMMDMSDHNHNFSPNPTPMGQGFGQSVGVSMG